MASPSRPVAISTGSPAPPGEVLVVLGAQWGDEGKGKLIDLLASRYDMVARCAGGSNAGHTIVVDDVKYAFHLLPSGLLNPHATAVIGNGVVVHVPSLMKELTSLEAQGIPHPASRVRLSDRAHLLFDYHQVVDGLREVERGAAKIGTTKKGVGPAYSSKANRTGLRVGDLRNFRSFPAAFRRSLASKHKRFHAFDYDVKAEVARYYEYAQTLEPNITDTVALMADAITGGERAVMAAGGGAAPAPSPSASVLVEGANAALLDVDFGTYPYVTSSNCTIGGVSTGLGIPPRHIEHVVGIVKAYTTRVGEGPFPTELLNEQGERLQRVGHEYGTTTARPRRCGWLDTFMLRYTNSVNGYTAVGLTKLDVLSAFDTLKIGTGYTVRGRRCAYYPASLETIGEAEVIYEELPGWEGVDITQTRTWEALPENARKYVERVEQLMGVPVQWIGVGPGRDAVIVRSPAPAS